MTAGAEAPVSGDCNAGLKGQLYRAGRVQRTAPGALTESKARFFYGWDVPAEPGTHSKTYLSHTKYNAREHALPNPRSSGLTMCHRKFLIYTVFVYTISV